MPESYLVAFRTQLAPHSHRVPAPSVTFFDMPYSRVTTDVSSEEQPLLPDGGGGRGHGTIRNS